MALGVQYRLHEQQLDKKWPLVCIAKRDYGPHYTQTHALATFSSVELVYHWS